MIASRCGLMASAKSMIRMGPGKLSDVCDAISKINGHPVPVSKQAKWKMLHRFVNGIACPPSMESHVKRVPIARLRLEQQRRVDVSSDSFLSSYAWRELRMKAIIRDGRRCACCGRTPDDGITINVDHILPRRTHPELALSLDNLQVLCNECNHGKGNWDTTNWKQQPVAQIWDAPRLVKK